MSTGPAKKRASRSSRWEGFDLKEKLRAVEKRYIKRALLDSGGNHSEAARLLNITRQALNYLLFTRYKDLVGTGRPESRQEAQE